mmetsp:Transcript_66807/g.132424  ORF Transcript_66807/g.132424 Transcript_66807/m.132424 type:complete len:207 (-) Transcript_66807:236-856(-)
MHPSPPPHYVCTPVHSLQVLAEYLAKQEATLLATTHTATGATTDATTNTHNGTIHTATAASASETTTPLSTATGASSAFVATYEWTELEENLNSLPPGLQVELPLDGGRRRARIPPMWALRVWLSNEHGFWRHADVTRTTTVGELRASAAAFVGVPVSKVRFELPRVPAAGPLAGEAPRLDLADELTAEQVDLFGQRAELHVVLCG